MLQEETLVSEMITMFNMVKELQNNSLFKDHVLAGGTALALQLGHRTSTDIDLFTQKPQNAIEFVNYFKKNYRNVNINIAKNDFIRIFANDIKIEIVQYEEKIIEDIKNVDGIRLFGKNEIAAMKLSTITHRTVPRDFIDIAYLLREIPLRNMFELYKEKFGMISPLYMRRTLLTKSRSIKDDEWLVGIKMLRHDIEPKDIPIFIENAIQEYNKAFDIGKQIEE